MHGVGVSRENRNVNRAPGSEDAVTEFLKACG